jgi:5-(carboxyamino)imidazole ribonucleotide synthase
VSGKVVLPGATIGIFGGGQLGRMSAMAARSLGYDVHILDPDAHCAASPLASRVVAAPFDDTDAAADLARGCDVVTLEIEQVHGDALRAAREHAPVHPAPDVIVTIQDRATQKEWLRDHGIPVAEFAVARNAVELATAISKLAPCIAKTTRGGYDGRGQMRFATAVSGESASEAWQSLGGRTLVVERQLDLEAEMSILVARHEAGDLLSYPPSLNYHENGILAWSVTPSDLPEEVTSPARDIAEQIANEFGLVGLVAVELFLTTDGRVVVNELAPRPHNSFHQTERACQTSQFEQLVRSVCGLPLGSADVAQPGAIRNLLGELWTHGEPPWPRALEMPGVRLHLYGKRGPRPGRKMGHLSSLGSTAGEALERVQAAFDALQR